MVKSGGFQLGHGSCGKKLPLTMDDVTGPTQQNKIGMTLYHFIETDSLVNTTSSTYIARPILYLRQCSGILSVAPRLSEVPSVLLFPALVRWWRGSPLFLDSGSF